MVKKGDHTSRTHQADEPCNMSAEFKEVLLEPGTAQKVSKRKGEHKTKRSASPIPVQQQKCKNRTDICAEPMQLMIDSGEMMDTEFEHEKELENLEQAIAEKRCEMRKQLDADHMKEKSCLIAKIQELEHARLTQQHNFRVAMNQKQDSIERLKKEFEKNRKMHCQRFEEFREQERSKTRLVKAEIDSIREKRDKLAPAIGFMEGRLQLASLPGGTGTTDNNITQAMLDDLEKKYEDTEKQNASEDQQLDIFTDQQVDMLMDEINNLDQQMDVEKRELKEMKEDYDIRLGDLQATLEQGKRHLTIDEEKQKIQEEVEAMKEYWRELRGHIEEQVDEILEHTEKKKFEGRDRLLKQRRKFFQERQKSQEVLLEMTAKLYTRERECETARDLFYDRVKTKTAELDEIEEIHAERLRGRCERRDKLMRELEAQEEERGKRLKLQSELYDSKLKQSKTGFEIKKTHLLGAITDTEARVDEVLEELRKPRQKDQDKLVELQGKLAEVEMKRDFLKARTQFAEEALENEVKLIRQEGEQLVNNYTTQVGAKQKELLALRKVDERERQFARKQVDINRKKFLKETEKITSDTDALQKYFDNLTQELNRLKAERLMLREEYIKTQEGIREAMLKDEDDVEIERDRIHHELDQEREEFNKAIQSLNARISDSRRKRHDMTTKFKQEVNNFTARAMGMGQGTTPGGGRAHSNMLQTYEDEIKKFSLRCRAINQKLELLQKEISSRQDADAQEKLRALDELQKQNDNLQNTLLDKQKKMKEGNMLLQLFSNEDNCLYCRKKNPTRSQKDQLAKLHDDNRILTEKLTKLFNKEREYDKMSSRQLEELRSTLEASIGFYRRSKAPYQKRKRSSSQSTTSLSSVFTASNG